MVQALSLAAQQGQVVQAAVAQDLRQQAQQPQAQPIQAAVAAAVIAALVHKTAVTAVQELLLLHTQTLTQRWQASAAVSLTINQLAAVIAFIALLLEQER